MAVQIDSITGEGEMVYHKNLFYLYSDSLYEVYQTRYFYHETDEYNKTVVDEMRFAYFGYLKGNTNGTWYFPVAEDAKRDLRFNGKLVFHTNRAYLKASSVWAPPRQMTIEVTEPEIENYAEIEAIFEKFRTSQF